MKCNNVKCKDCDGENCRTNSIMCPDKKIFPTWREYIDNLNNEEFYTEIAYKIITLSEDEFLRWLDSPKKELTQRAGEDRLRVSSKRIYAQLKYHFFGILLLRIKVIQRGVPQLLPFFY